MSYRNVPKNINIAQAICSIFITWIEKRKKKKTENIQYQKIKL